MARERAALRGGLGIVLIVLLISVAGCARPNAIEGKEVAHKLDFYKELKVRVTKDSAADYRVYVSAIDHDEGGDVVLRTNSRDGVAMDWVDKDILKLTIPCGRVFAFTNFFEIVDPGGRLMRRVSIELDADGALTCL
jgi:hypothetical protein